MNKVLIPKSWWGQLEARLRAFARLGCRPGLLALVYVEPLPYTPVARFSGLTASGGFSRADYHRVITSIQREDKPAEAG